MVTLAGDQKTEFDPVTGEEYIVIEDVPVFDEHTDDEGTYYGRDELAAIAQNNNLRIKDTGDYTPIVMHHTSDDKNLESDPEVVGFAGPFKVKTFGKEKPRPCIYARFRIRSDAREKVKHRNRRSVEVWALPNVRDRFLDPIALLGAETPQRDLGIIKYSRAVVKRYRLSGNTKHRYEMSSTPGGSNTFLAGEVKRNMMGDPQQPLAASSETINQIIEGMKPVIQQMIEDRLSNVIGGDLSPVDVPSDEPPGGPLMDPNDTSLEEVNEPIDPIEPPADEVPVEDGLSDDDKHFAKMTYSRKIYSLGDDMDGARAALDGLGDDRDLVEQYMKSCDDDDMVKHYKRCCGDAGEEAEKKQYAMKYRSLSAQHSQLKVVYAKAKKQNSKLQADNSKLATENRKLRYQRKLLDKQMEGYAFDLEDETDRVLQMTDDLADDYIESTITRLPQVPIGDLRIEGITDPAKQYSMEARTETRSQKYSRKAADVTRKLRQQGRDIAYKEVLDHMVEHDTDKYDPAA